MTGRNKKGQFTRGNKLSGGAKATKYRREYARDIIKYFDITPTKEVTRGGRRETVINEYPMFEGFAKKIGVTSRTLLSWCEKHKEFAEAYERCKDMQRYILVTNSLLSRYNSGFAKFIAMNHHGMSEKVERDDAIPQNDIQVSINLIDPKEAKDESTKE